MRGVRFDDRDQKSWSRVVIKAPQSYKKRCSDANYTCGGIKNRPVDMYILYMTIMYNNHKSLML